MALHVQPAFLKYGDTAPYMPVAEQLTKEVLSLPMHTELDEDALAYIVEQIKNFYN
ncbi:MAG: DegT/DnrJ/EryC1/StrS family aminotransferase [Bacteroidota bacterium]